jgi:nucleoid-associated protein YgaU
MSLTMPSQKAAIWAGATGAAVVVAGAVAVYWAHPRFLWPNPVPVVVTEQAGEAPAPTVPAAPTAEGPSPAPAAGPAAQPAPGKPAFDVVSVQPTGEAVVAGRAAPNAKVELKDGGKTVAEATANAEGQFVMIPPPLPPGEHSLALSTGVGPSAETSNAITVAVAPPEPAPKAAAAASSAPQPSSTALAVPPASGPASRVAVQSIEASAGGRLVAKGAAEPNALVRLYLSGAFVGDAKTSADGRWSLTIEHGMTPGPYEMRADEINPADAKVTARAQAPFDYPATAAAAPVASAGSPPSPAAAASPADVVLDSIQTHHVASGHTLWGISQKFYGDGSRYQIIFAANSSQIKNPNLIYPGQTFVVPKTGPKP